MPKFSKKITLLSSTSDKKNPSMTKPNLKKFTIERKNPYMSMKRDFNQHSQRRVQGRMNPTVEYE